MYCPLNDGHIIHGIQKFAQEIFEEKVSGFRQMYESVRLKGTNDFQNLICTLPAIDISNSDILLFDKVAADYDNKNLLDEFWEKHQMQLQKPSVSKSTDREIFFVVAALMQLKAFWDPQHAARIYYYNIYAADSYANEDMAIKGFLLGNVRVALNKHFEAVSVIVDLGQDITIRLSDHTVFGNRYLEIHDEKQLYEMITATQMNYFADGSLLAPCIEEIMMVENHLQGINWISNDSLYQVHVESSEALTKLKLNEKGVEARAETVAKSKMLIGASMHDMPKTYQLKIVHGLIVDIRHKDQSLFVVYVPQERFIRK